jgi:hypothetical protein
MRLFGIVWDEMFWDEIAWDETVCDQSVSRGVFAVKACSHDEPGCLNLCWLDLCCLINSTRDDQTDRSVKRLRNLVSSRSRADAKARFSFSPNWPGPPVIIPASRRLSIKSRLEIRSEMFASV